jgi:hypothetical protein
VLRTRRPQPRHISKRTTPIGARATSRSRTGCSPRLGRLDSRSFWPAAQPRPHRGCSGIISGPERLPAGLVPPRACNSRSLPPPTPVKQTDRGEASERNAAGVAVLRKAWGLTARSWLAWGTLRRLTPAFGNGQLGMRSWNKSRPSAIYHAECNNSLDTRQCSRLERPP